MRKSTIGRCRLCHGCSSFRELYQSIYILTTFRDGLFRDILNNLAQDLFMVVSLTNSLIQTSSLKHAVSEYLYFRRLL